MLFHRNTGVWFSFVLSWGLISSIFTFYSSLLIMKMDILIKAVIPVRRQNVVSFNMRLLMNVLKRKKKEKKNPFYKGFLNIPLHSCWQHNCCSRNCYKGR